MMAHYVSYSYNGFMNYYLYTRRYLLYNSSIHTFLQSILSVIAVLPKEGKYITCLLFVIFSFGFVLHFSFICAISSLFHVECYEEFCKLRTKLWLIWVAFLHTMKCSYLMKSSSCFWRCHGGKMKYEMWTLRNVIELVALWRMNTLLPAFGDPALKFCKGDHIWPPCGPCS